MRIIGLDEKLRKNGRPWSVLLIIVLLKTVKKKVRMKNTGRKIDNINIIMGT
jgi:hypothetical protein